MSNPLRVQVNIILSFNWKNSTLEPTIISLLYDKYLARETVNITIDGLEIPCIATTREINLNEDDEITTVFCLRAVHEKSI